MSVRQFAAHLGVSVSTVANWEQRGERIRLRTETQHILDADLRLAPDEVRARFVAALSTTETRGLPGIEPPEQQSTRVALADGARHAEPLVRATEVVLRGDVTTSLDVRLCDALPLEPLPPPARIGADDLNRIEAATAVFRDWDNRWGGGLSRDAVLAQLRWVSGAATHARCTSTSVKNRLVAAVADLAGVAAFLCYDVTDHPTARALWLFGLEASRECDNAALTSSTLLQLAHQALHLERSGEALGLVRLAYATAIGGSGPVSELVLAEIAAYESWCYAAAGEAQPCHRAFGRAQEHFDNTAVDDVPPWLAHFDRTELTALGGHSYHVLACTVPSAADDAIALLTEAIDNRPREYARSQTLNRIALAATHVQRGEHIEEGVAVGERALDGVDTLTSPRAVDRLRRLRSLLSGHLDVPGVEAFRDRLDLAVAHA